jgi:FtsH-binding integral membrane protein
MTTAPPQYRDPSSEPLLAQASSSNGIFNQPDDGDLPDDFKYGTSVADSAPEIRAAFVRKVYTILFCQLLGTCVVGGLMSSSVSAVAWVQMHSWTLLVGFMATLVNLGLLFWKRHSHPWNFVLLSTFTVFEALTLGVVMAFYDTVIVLEALLITLGIFLGLTLFTFQSKYDFSGMGPFLFGGLVGLIITGLVGMLFPFSKIVDLVYGAFGAFLFSGYIVFDTYNINRRLSPDEFIVGAISLYLDFINLFLSILRVLNNIQDR